jgi:hypothetical protein
MGLKGRRIRNWAGRIMAVLFGESWGEFTKLHSRFFCES